MEIQMRLYKGISSKKLGTYSRVVKNPVSSQTDKLMAGTKFSDYLGLKHYKKAKN